MLDLWLRMMNISSQMIPKEIYHIMDGWMRKLAKTNLQIVYSTIIFCININRRHISCDFPVWKNCLSASLYKI